MQSTTIPRAAAVLGTAAALALPAAAQAHVTIQPDTAEAGSFTRVNVRVPNERDKAGTSKVQVQLPSGFEFVSYEPRPGWTVAVEKSGDSVREITWTGHGRQGVIGPGQFMDFGLSVKMPDGKPGQKLTFKAIQTYDNGEVVRWIGPEDAEEPAPTVTLTAAGGEEPAPASSTTTSDDGGGSDTLSIIALIVGALGLAAGGAALATRRRTRVAA
jgi:periplasmic copper chaperone A